MRVSLSVLLPNGDTMYLCQQSGESRDEFRGRALCEIEDKFGRRKGARWAEWAHDGHPLGKYHTNGLGVVNEHTGNQYTDRYVRVPGIYNETEAWRALGLKTLCAQFSASPAGPFQTVLVPARDVPLWWHKKGLSFTASGYGRRIPTRHMVRINDRWRRVYCCIFSNSGTYYVEDTSQPKRIREGGTVPRYEWIVISD